MKTLLRVTGSWLECLIINPLLGLQEVSHQGLTEIKCTGIFRTFLKAWCAIQAKLNLCHHQSKPQELAFLDCYRVLLLQQVVSSNEVKQMFYFNFEITRSAKGSNFGCIILFLIVKAIDFLFCTLCLIRSYIQSPLNHPCLGSYLFTRKLECDLFQLKRLSIGS